jgi:hypothetical protein
MNYSEQIVKDQAMQYIKEMVDYIKVKYNCSEMVLKVVLDFSDRARCSRAGRDAKGRGTMKLAMARFLRHHNANLKMHFTEYDSFKSSPIIGELDNVTWRIALRATIAHEIAHVVQFVSIPATHAAEVLGFSAYDGVSKQFKGHGKFFKEIYADLREEFVNSFVLDSSKPVGKIRKYRA